jgi:DNA polymerase III delta prime subunit
LLRFKTEGAWLWRTREISEVLIQVRDALCTTAHARHLWDTGALPDFLHITPQEKKNYISIEQIRLLSEWVTTTSSITMHKVAVISPAHCMNHFAAHALLKTLEEPMPGVGLILVSDHPDQLLATLKSRCIMIQEALPETVDHILEAEIVRDITALQHHTRSAIQVAERWKLRATPYAILPILMRAAHDRAIMNTDRNKRKFWSWVTLLQEATRTWHEMPHLNVLLFWEGLLLHYAAAC